MVIANYRIKPATSLSKFNRSLMRNSPVIAKTLDEVITHLENIVKESKKNKSRAGYFAALYHKVTVRVKEDIEKGQFSNGNSLANLDITFANRYFDAYQKWKNGEPVSKSWKVAFENCEKPSRLVLQQLLLGMNAHINFDLGIATVEVANGDIDSYKNDFDAINIILSSLTYGIISKLNVISPLLSTLGFSGTSSNFMLIQFSMGNARDGSWCFAEKLSGLYKDQAAYSKAIEERDTEIAELGNSLTKTTGILTIGLWLIHLFELKNVNRVIKILSEYAKPYMKDMKKFG